MTLQLGPEHRPPDPQLCVFRKGKKGPGGVFCGRGRISERQLTGENLGFPEAPGHYARMKDFQNNGLPIIVLTVYTECPMVNMVVAWPVNSI